MTRSLYLFIFVISIHSPSLGYYNIINKLVIMLDIDIDSLNFVAIGFIRFK